MRERERERKRDRERERDRTEKVRKVYVFQKGFKKKLIFCNLHYVFFTLFLLNALTSRWAT
jgi:hypothetical protein